LHCKEVALQFTRHFWKTNSTVMNCKNLKCEAPTSLASPVFVLLLTMGTLTCFGQIPQPTVKPPSYPSPNAASLGKYGDIPVSYYSGIPNISVPIFTIKEGSLELPISLSYHSSGVKVDEVSSWVGLGWSLNAGGMITRSIQGGRDEGRTSLTQNKSNLAGWGFFRNGGIPSQIETCKMTPHNTIGGSSSCFSYFFDAGQGYIDTEPDTYTFNVNGLSGKFFFDEFRGVHMIPEGDLSIQPDDYAFTGWKIIAPGGIKYFFGTTAATEQTFAFPSQSIAGFTNDDYLTTTTWYLYRMESPNGEDWISFEYEDEYYAFGNRKGHQTVHLSSTGFAGDHYQRSNVEPSATAVKGKRLRKITTSSGFTTVDFLPKSVARIDLNYSTQLGWYLLESVNTSAKALDEIVIHSGVLQKKFVLSTSYFDSAPCSGCSNLLPYSANIDAKRLRLDAVQEFDEVGNSIPQTTFQYDGTSLPRRYSLARDKWGYYNGYDGNDGLFQDGYLSPFGVIQQTGDFRNVNETKMMAGVLTKIQYPTGGSTSFYYEANRLSNGGEIVGGLRISRIENHDGNRIARTRIFEYGNGILYNLIPDPVQYQYPRASHPSWYVMEDFGTIVHADLLPGLRSNHGHHIGYSQVSETDGSGKTIYTYYTTPPVQPLGIDFPPRPAFAGLGTGELFSEETQNQSNTLKKSTNYNEIGGLPTTIRAIKVVNTPCYSKESSNPENIKQECILSPYPFLTEYILSTNRYQLMSREEYQDGVQTRTSFEYGLVHNSPIATTTTNSDGVVFRTEYDYPGASNGAPFEMYQLSHPNFKNMLTTVVEKRDKVGGSLVAKQVSTFSSNEGKVLMTKSENYPTGNGIPQIENYLYDKMSNLIEIEKSTGEVESFIWGYSNQYPVASVKNGKLSRVPSTELTNFGASITSNVGSFINIGTYSRSESDLVSIEVLLTGGGSGQHVKVQIKDEAGSTVFGPNEYVTPGTYSAPAITLPAGRYTIWYSASGFTATNFVSLTVKLSGTIYRQRSFYNGFEEDGDLLPDAFSGSRVNLGSYKVPLPYQPGTYIVSFWKKTSASDPWQREEQSVTVNNGGIPSELTVGQGAFCMDEFRLQPIGSQMTTYNYYPGLGLSTMVDTNGNATYYEYDSFGRLKLTKDKDRAVKALHQYRYKN
jgi:hypothetical protein